MYVQVSKLQDVMHPEEVFEVEMGQVFARISREDAETLYKRLGEELGKEN